MLAVLAGLPGSLVALTMIWTSDLTPKAQWTLTLLIVVAGYGLIAALQREVVYPLRTVSNMLVALGEGDFSMRARRPRVGDALGQVMGEVNELGDMLREQRLGALEATSLLRKVMAGIDVAVFTFDADQRLQFVNQRGEHLLAQSAERLLGRSAEELGLASCLLDEESRILETTFPGGAGRWEMRQSTFRVGGVPHRLVLLSDLTRALREQERQAWQRLIQVLRHEINNSLAPIDSLAGSLAALLARDPRPADWEMDMREGLDVISQRSNALNRFMTAYSKLTRLPKPKPGPVDVESWVRQVSGLESRVRITVMSGPAATIHADRDQLDQLLINLVRNASDAAAETGGGVHVGWTLTSGRVPWLEVWVEDEGPGLADTDNLFVPFFTTKPEGSGIGLALSRQIAEAHGGRLTLQNRPAERGCRACLHLPVSDRAT
ncbi:MAG: hypothetical protein JSV91_03210 [Phycisphaerales bacterium]|nr:MAG: hypothetical protein JSV91_03210 [Phycisphaerales bacterium]